MGLANLSLKDSFLFTATCGIVSYKSPFTTSTELQCDNSTDCPCSLQAIRNTALELPPNDLAFSTPSSPLRYSLSSKPSLSLDLFPLLICYVLRRALNLDSSIPTLPGASLVRISGTACREGLETMDDAHYIERKNVRIRQVIA